MSKQTLKRLVHFFILLMLILSLGVQTEPTSALEPIAIVVNSIGDEPDSADNSCL